MPSTHTGEPGDTCRTFSLTEIAAILCGDSLKSPERWVTKQILSGRFTAIKVGRHWRMTQAQLDDAVAVLSSPQPETTPNGLSAASARRRLVSA